ncbi:MAG: N-formylglutamate amidohydrolase [Boseongicola sp.]|nr:N-formylglutamate amidohydrolase [Boseongicola sp.]
MIDVLPMQILSPKDGPAAEVVNLGGRAAICLVCEHASRRIPESLGTLGLSTDDQSSHAAWDLGAGDLARQLSGRLDAPLVLGRISRLVHDCNRPPEQSDATPERTETIDIPGNRNLTSEERSARAREVYEAFHQLLSDTLDGFDTKPVLVTVHSFTPQWFGKKRDTQIGLLHDASDGMARAMMEVAPDKYKTELNQPYSAADGVTHLLAKHGTSRSIDNVMIEVRNDLLDDDAAIEDMAKTLTPMIEAAIERVGNS